MTRDPAGRLRKSRHAPEVAILRWNRSTAGTTAPICPRTVADGEERPPAQRSSTLPRPANAPPHGRESARHLEATRRDVETVEGDAEEERDLSRRRRAEEAALYMEEQVRCGSTQAQGGGGGAEVVGGVALV